MFTVSPLRLGRCGGFSFWACHGRPLCETSERGRRTTAPAKRGLLRLPSLSHPQHGANLCHAPGEAAIDTDGAEWAIFHAGPASQSLRAAVQVVGSGGGVHCGAVHQFQRGELLGLRYSAAGVCAVLGCLHRFALSTQHHRPGMVHTFFGASLALKTAISRCNPHECWVPRGIACPGFSCPICPGVSTLIAVCFVRSICP